MADNKGPGAPALDTNIESGGFDEKRPIEHVPAEGGVPPQKTTKAPVEDEEEDEDIDALIEDLESEDGHQFEEEEDDETPGGGRQVPEDMLQTDSRVGLTEAEVLARRKKYGYNRMKEEKENHFLKFLSFFIGPIQFVMEVSIIPMLRCIVYSSALFLRTCFHVSPTGAATVCFEPPIAFPGASLSTPQATTAGMLAP